MIAQPTIVDILSSQNNRNINSLQCVHKEMRRRRRKDVQIEVNNDECHFLAESIRS